MAVASDTSRRASANRDLGSAEWLVPAALAVALLAAAVFYYTRGTHLSFYVDEWDFMLHRRGHSVSIFLDPQHGNLVAVPILIYKALFGLFGVSSYAPFRLVALAIELTCATLFFALVRRRVGDAIALAATVTVLFLGPAWEPLVSPVSIIALSSLAAGLGMLLALESPRRHSDLVAALLLGISLASFSYGPAFAAAAAVDVLLRPEARRRIWLVIVPGALYVLWMIGYGQSQIIAGNIPGVPRAVFDSIGADLISITGLYRPTGVTGGPLFDTAYAPPLAVAMVVVIAIAMRTPARRAPRLYALVVLALCFWVEIALVLDPGRTTSSSRYIYPGVVLLLLMCAEIARGRRLRRRGLIALAVVTGGLLIAVQIPDLNQGATALGNLGRFDRAELTALDLGRGVVAPAFMPEPLPSPQLGHHYLEHIDAGSYYRAVDAFGSPAYTVAELLRAPAGPRAAADEVLSRAIGVAPHPVSGPAAGAACRELAPAPSPVVVSVPPGGFVLTAGQATPIAVRLRRFGGDFGPFAVALPAIAGRGSVVVPIHPDSAGVPWRAQLSGVTQPVRLCALA
jgi:hypothetical protein